MNKRLDNISKECQKLENEKKEIIMKEDEYILQIVGKNLKRIRNEKNISQETLGQYILNDNGYISRLEKGLNNPAFTTVLRIIKSLNIEFDDLLAGIDFDDENQ